MQTYTVSECHIGINLPNHQYSGVKDYFKKQFFLQGWISIFFFQGQKLKLEIFAGIKNIF